MGCHDEVACVSYQYWHITYLESLGEWADLVMLIEEAIKEVSNAKPVL